MEIAIILKAPNLKDCVKEESVIYADAGYNLKGKVGDKKVLAVVGDFDSLGAPPKDQSVIKLNKEKDLTDGERAVQLAKEFGAESINIYGATGGNIEHILGNLALLKIAKNLHLKARITDNGKVIMLISKNVCLKAKKGTKLSLIPYGGACSFCDSRGLYYPLKDITLTPADTKGISNEVVLEEVEIAFNSGEALVVFEE